MCGNSVPKNVSTANADPSLYATEETVAKPLPDGYWLNAFPFSTSSEFPDLVGYGLGFLDKSAAISFYHNPKNTGSRGWRVTEIQRLDFPVAMTFADLTGNGYNDIIICDRFGPGIDQLWDAETNDGGRVLWLKNPGDRSSVPFWEAKRIGNSTGTHRLQVGHFTTKQSVQIMAFPVAARASDLESPAPVIVYTPQYGPDPSSGPETWTKEIVFDSQFRLIHDVKLVPGTNDAFDMVLVSGREGLCLLYYGPRGGTSEWQYNVIGEGLPQEPGNPFWGSGCVDFARVGDDSVGYVATCEAFHGNIVSVYIKGANAPKGPDSLKDSSLWTRVVVDNFGPLTEQYTGTIHHIATADLDKIGVESFTVACMGAPITKPENQGVYVYKPTDLIQGKFERTKVTNESAGRIAIAGFSQTLDLDIASLSYYVPGFHTGPDPPSIRINVYNPRSSTTITNAALDS